ncbi:MAG: aldehyde dehydrogenase family protein [Bacteroidota bacterium]
MSDFEAQLDRISKKKYKMLIDGKWENTSSKKTFSRKSPSHDIVVGHYQEGTKEDVEKAVTAARAAFDSSDWAVLSGSVRAKILLKIAGGIEQRLEELALVEVMESGKPIAQARDEIRATVELWEYAATLCRHNHGDSHNTLGKEVLGLILREPIGVVGIITPWNFPLLIVSQKLPFALAAGCTSVVKPSELTPGTTLILGEIIQNSGIPKGVVNIVTGYGFPVGSTLAGHLDVDMISFTGSTVVGKKIVVASQSNLKKISLELGGKNPQIVFPDCDLDAAVDAVVFGVYFNMGECCNSGSRLLVHESIGEEFTRRVIALSKKVKVGNPLDETTKVGAIISKEQLDKVLGYVEDSAKEGAVLALGGKRAQTKQGRYLEPTIITAVSPKMKVAREEVFGPVLAIMTFKNEEEAVQLANDTIYGLSAGIWTSDITTALNLSRKIKAGTIWVNSFMDGYPELPFGGYKQSGVGRELGRFGLEEFTELKTVQLHIGKRNNRWID